MRVAVIIPTYNEARSIEALIASLVAVYGRLPQHEFHTVVVDADSPDGTAALVERLAVSHPRVHLLKEPNKSGIANAYRLGIRYVFDRIGADAFFEFDGDGQHDPGALPQMLKELEKGTDLVIGSRYVDGGSIPQEWAFYRKVLSRLGSLYARVLLELPVHDVTSGLKVTRTQFARRMPMFSDGDLLSSHYAYKFQYLDEVVQRNGAVREVPITFLSREHDESKSTWKDILDSLKVTALLRLRRLSSWRIPKVIMIGAGGFLLQALFFEFVGIRFELLRPSTAAVLGGEIAIVSNFFLNNIFTFSDRRESGLVRRFIKFQVVSLGSVFVQWLFVAAAELLEPRPAVLRLAYISGVIVGFVFNFSGYYFWVWKKGKA